MRAKLPIFRSVKPINIFCMPSFFRVGMLLGTAATKI